MAQKFSTLKTGVTATEKFSFASGINYILIYYNRKFYIVKCILNCNTSHYFLFCCMLDQTNALVSIRYFLEENVRTVHITVFLWLSG